MANDPREPKPHDAAPGAVVPGTESPDIEGPPPPADEERGESPSYWELTRHDLLRNKMAMIGLVVVVFVATVAVFCPLIANNRPYYIKAVFENSYDESYFVTLDLAARVETAATGQGAVSARDVVSKMRNALDGMEMALSGDQADRLRELRNILLAYASNPREADRGDFNAALDAFRAEFDLEYVSLGQVARFPVFRVLTGEELFFIYAYLLLLPFWYLVRPRVRSFVAWTALLAVAAAVLTVATTTVFPRVQDSFPYRNFTESQAFRENGWKVIPALIPYGENENITSEARQPPTFLMSADQRNPDQRFHLFGTDTNGRDVLSRMVYGARISMLVGIVAVSLYTVIGVLLGAFAGYFGGWIDLSLSRLIEIVICFPVLFLILAVQAFLRPSIVNIMVALALIAWTGVARLQRGEFLRLVNMEFVQSVRALGGSHLRIIFLHILPNALAPILVLVSFGIAASILVESTLSFLGFGVPQPTASWGDLLNNGRNDIQGTWWLTVFPGLAIFITVTCFNLLGEGVRDALDPRRNG